MDEKHMISSPTLRPLGFNFTVSVGRLLWRAQSISIRAHLLLLPKTHYTSSAAVNGSPAES